MSRRRNRRSRKTSGEFRTVASNASLARSRMLNFVDNFDRERRKLSRSARQAQSYSQEDYIIDLFCDNLEKHLKALEHGRFRSHQTLRVLKNLNDALRGFNRYEKGHIRNRVSRALSKCWEGIENATRTGVRTRDREKRFQVCYEYIAACKSASVLPSKEFFNEWCHETAENLPDNIHDVALTCSYLAALGLQPNKELMDALEDKILTLVEDQPRETYRIEQIIWACAVWDAISSLSGRNPEVMSPYEDLAEYLFIESYKYPKQGVNRRLSQISLWFDWPYEFDMSKSEFGGSRSEDNLIELFEKHAGYEATQTPAEILGPMGHQVDYAHVSERRKIVFEFDGPSHINRYPDKERDIELARFPDGSTILQSALMAKLSLSAVVMRMPFPVCDYLKTVSNTSLKQRVSDADFLMREALALEPGVYSCALAQDADDKKIEVLPMAYLLRQTVGSYNDIAAE